MRVALVHDYIKEYGGAERVLEALHEIWPSAPVYTTVYLPEFLGPHRERFINWDIRTSFLQYIPFKEKLISPFRIIAPFVFRSFDLSDFDVVIVSATGAYFPNMVDKKKNIVIARSEERTKELACLTGVGRATRQSHTEQGIASPLRGLAMTKRKRAIHICYCHTPPRYLYGYATAREWKKNLIFRIIGEIGNHFLRLVDFKSSQNVDYFIANSKNVAERIKKFYKRDSAVIYPPVDFDFALRSLRQFKNFSNASVPAARYRSPRDTPRFAGSSEKFLHAKTPRAKNEYFLAGGRLARPKHIDLIVRACRELKVPLKVFGRVFGGWENDLKSASQNSKIEFVGEVSDEEKLELMRNAKAYIFAAEDEDFGVTLVEAMSVGTPVIAYKSGGVVESIIEGKTGLFFNELTIESLISAIQKLNDSNHFIKREDCIKQAQKFSKERFKKEIKEFVEKKLQF